MICSNSEFNSPRPVKCKRIPPDNGWYLLFSSGFYNAKCVLKIGGLQFRTYDTLYARYSKSKNPQVGAARNRYRYPVFRRGLCTAAPPTPSGRTVNKNVPHATPCATSRLTTRNTMSIWISGATIYNISKSLGHSTVATTSMIYTHLLDTTHEQTIEAVAQNLHKGRHKKRRKYEIFSFVSHFSLLK